MDAEDDGHLSDTDRQYIDSLLDRVRFAPAGSRWFRGERGDYWLARLRKLKAEPGGQSALVAASKEIG